MNKRHFIILGMALLGLIIFSDVKAQSPVKDKESVKAFVQKFYDWYVPLCDLPPNKRSASPLTIALSKGKTYFVTSLYKALVAYINTPVKNKGEIEGLDFDPFLNAQDTGPKYFASHTSQVGDKLLVYVVDANKKNRQKSVRDGDCLVITELVKENGHWAFSNFIYPIEGKRYNLLKMLQDLKKGV